MRITFLTFFIFYSAVVIGNDEVSLSARQSEVFDVIHNAFIDPIIPAESIGLPEDYDLRSLEEKNQIEYFIGDRYFRNKAYEEAFGWFLIAAQGGLPEAKYKLAVLYENNFPERGNVDKTFNLFLEAARAGILEAQIEVADIYATTDDKSPFKKFADSKKAYQWYTKLAESNVPEAQYKLARIYDVGLFNVNRNREKAFEWYLKAAENNFAEAQYEIGLMYEEGKEVEENLDRAILWYKRAIDNGSSFAKYQLARLYEEGKGIEKNVKKAARLYNEIHLHEAQARLRHLMSEHSHTPGFLEALKVTNSELIDMNNVDSNSIRRTSLSAFLNARQKPENKQIFVKDYHSQEMYDAHQRGNLLYTVNSNDLNTEQIYDGRISSNKLERTIHRSSLSPEQMADYYTTLANLYRSGFVHPSYALLGEQDVLAVMFYKQAVKIPGGSDGTAEYWLGLMHEEGRGVEKDMEKAIEWYQKSIELSNETNRFERSRNIHPLYSIGTAEALYRLARIYEKRIIEDKDNKVIHLENYQKQKQLVSYYEKAAQLGLAAAQYRLAQLYLEGLFNTFQSSEKAVQWLRQVIFQSVNIQTYYKNYASLGVTGTRYQLDLERLLKAQYLLAKALAEKGNAEAAFNLAIMYEEGRGITQNLKEAVDWYERAMEKGYVEAYYRQGLLYEEGRGVAQNMEKAVQLYKKAQSHGLKEAREKFNQIQGNSPGQRCQKVWLSVVH